MFIIPLILSILSLTQSRYVTECTICSELIDKHADAMGGKKRWRKLHSYKMIYRRENGGELDIIALMPDRLELRFTRDGELRQKIYDGDFGYILRNGKYEPMRKGEMIEMEEEPVYYSELIFAIDNAYDLSYLGLESIEGKACHKISMKKSKVDEHIYWLDAQTYLIHMTGEYSEDPAHAGIYYKTLLEDYRSVEGYMFPYKQSLIPDSRNPIVSVAEDIKVQLEEIRAQDFEYQPDNSENLIRYWKDRYAEQRLHAFSFVQETVRYQNGMPDTSTWYEAVEYPDRFRIVFGDKSEGNTNIYRNDSVYSIRNGQLVHSAQQIQEFMIMEGSVYCNPVDTTLAKLWQTNVDTEQFHVCSYKGRKTYVIGALEGDLAKPQVWLDASRRSTSRRFMKLPDGRLMEVQYSDFRSFGDHDIETWLEFYIDGKVFQTERYYNINVEPEFDESIFDPVTCLDNYWY